MKRLLLVLALFVVGASAQEPKSIKPTEPIAVHLSADETKAFTELIQQENVAISALEKAQAEVQAAQKTIENTQLRRALILVRAKVPEAWWNNGTLNPTEKVWIFSAPEKPKE